MAKIQEEFPESRVIDLFDDEYLNWVDPDWEEDGYDSEYDWYVDHNNRITTKYQTLDGLVRLKM